MVQAMAMTVRLGEDLHEFVASNVSKTGSYETISEYVRDLIRRDKERVENAAFENLKAELQLALSAPEASFVTITAEQFFARHRR
ncbi:type II toxin-antitoxin system ParD family antitoxin [Devosia sp. LjRoot16]|uniref:ribbon-helix-helix domain-containing protein n=1 Tax=Devosia sp. LjRoot16 TaxID=3342271 RepID=UPI003ED0788F